MTTRIFLLTSLLLSLLACNSTPVTEDGTWVYFDPDLTPFYHGVASGDPLEDAVIIWTRVTTSENKPVTVEWTVSTDKDMRNRVQAGSVNTDESRDFTVKVDVQNLEPDTRYYYQFKALGKKSVIGRTKTAAANQEDKIKLAIVSCSNYEAGYYNAFARIAEREDLDAVVHLGDYIYEYAPTYYGDTTLGQYRRHLPPKEILSLQDYRTRYAQYRLDRDFQKVHQMHPFITIWDDHEISNNAYQSGAQNHQKDEGDYQNRRANAQQVYFEWLPVRDNASKDIYRTISFGNLVDLIVLDERLAGRVSPVDSASHPDLNAASRTMLGGDQLNWFKDQLASSRATWKVIGNQVIFSSVDFSWRNPKSPFNLDAWDGYPFERDQIKSFIAENEISNVIFTTGDTHCSWAFETPLTLEAYRADSIANSVAVEFATPSISSANFDERPLDIGEIIRGEMAFVTTGHNPHLKYVNLRDHGYLLLSLDEEKATAEWFFVDQIAMRSDKEQLGMRIEVLKNTHQLIIDEEVESR